jgi:hypothetical protein
LCDGEEKRAILAKQLYEVRPALSLDAYAAVAVWVPDRDNPEPQGVLQTLTVVPDEGEEGTECSRERFRGIIETPSPRVTVYSRSIDEVDVPAGPALVLRSVTARSDDPREEERRPAGCCTWGRTGWSRCRCR